MKERPILFSAPMIRALLDSRKTQTRRIITRLPGFGPITEFGPSDTAGYDWHFRDKAMRWHDIDQARLLQCCPYGQLGDRLWVKETFTHVGSVDPGYLLYRASDYREQCRAYGMDMATVPPVETVKWASSIFMPRRASRILLEVVSVRVERLQDISEADAIAEGIERHATNGYWIGGPHPTDGGRKYHAAPRLAYRDLWNSINSNRPTLPRNPDSKRYARVKKWLDTHPDTTSWDANPWVWAVEFRRLP